MGKLFITFFILSGFLFAQQTEFIVGAEHVSAMGNFSEYGPVPHSDYYWDKVKEFGLNYAGLKYFQKYPDDINPTVGTRSKTDIIADISKANALGIKVFLYNGFDHYESDPRVDPQRWLYQLEETGDPGTVDFLSLVNAPNDFDINALTHWDLADPEQDNPNFIHLRPGIEPYGEVASNLREQELQPDGQKYQLKIRMRLPDAITYEHVPVCTLKVYLDEGAEIEGYVYADDFSNNNWKEVHIMCFMKYPDGPVYCSAEDPPDIYTYPDSVGTNQIPNMVIDPEVTNTPYDYRIYWSSTAPYNYTVDIDYIVVDDKNAHKLFTGVWDARIADAVNNDYLNNTGIVNFQAHDEVPVTHLFATRYIQQKMQSVLGSSDRYPLSYHYYTPPIQYTHPAPITKRYIWETGMNILFTFVYPFHYGDNVFPRTPEFPDGTVYPDDPDQNAYNSYVQENRFDLVLIPSLEDHIAGALQFEKPFWFVPQAHKWRRQGEEWQREPSPYEIKAMTNLAVCYGAKGIFYYLYAHSWAGRNEITGFYYHDPNNYDGLIREYDDYNYPKWNTIKDYNHQLLAMGDELMSLTWQNSVYIHDGTQPTNSYITNVESVQDIPVNTYIQLGLFKSTDNLSDQNLEHFFIVNRRTDENDDRDIEVQYDKSGTNPNNFYNWTVKEVGTTNYWSSASLSNQFTTTYEPGDGKLFKLQPTVIGGGDLLYNETITSSVELHGDLVIQSGVTLTVNADYHCYGNIVLNSGSIKTTGQGKLYFYNGAGIETNGISLIYSNTANKLELDFVNTENNSGVYTRVGGFLNIYNCIIRNSGAGIHTEHHINSVFAENVDFYNCSNYAVNITGPASSLTKVINCTFNNCYGGISVSNVSEIQISGNQITNSDIGIYLSNVPQPYITWNTILSGKKTMPGIFISSSNGLISSNYISGHTNAIHLANSSPDIGANTIEDNLYHGIYIGAGSLPDMHAELLGEDPQYYAVSGYNTISENGGYNLPGPPDNDGSEIYLYYSNVQISKGCNSINDNREPDSYLTPPLVNTKLLMNGYNTGVPTQVYAEDNFWGEHPIYRLEERFGNLAVYFEPTLSEPCYYEQGEALFVKSSEGEVVDTVYSIDRTTGSLSLTEVLYSKAEEKYISADYSSAEQLYNQVVTSNDTLFAKQLAYQRLYEIGKITSKPAGYFNNLYAALSSASQLTDDSLLQKKFSQLASLSLVGEEEYIPAIEEFDEIIQQNPGTEEAVYAEIDALTTALLIEPGDTTLGKTAAGKYLTSIGEYGNRIIQLVKNNFGAKTETKEDETIPTDFVLYQNYPNPFNPSTTIKFDLPKTGSVELIVYDILGRKVASLLNETKEAGRYEFQFDASKLASGVYIYQLKSNEYINSKKMILLK